MLENLYTKNNMSIKEMIKELIKMILPLIISIILSKIISSLILNIMNIPVSNIAAKQISYFDLGIVGGIKYLFKTILFDYILNGLFYFPIAILNFAIITLLIISIIKSISYKKVTTLFIALGMIVSVFSLSFIQGHAAPYRTCQSFALFVAFVFMMLVQLVIESNFRNSIKTALIVIVAFINFYQISSLHNIFYMNYLRYQEEKIALINIANELQTKYNTDKPVVFIGNYELSDYIKEKLYIKQTDLRVKFIRKLGNMLNMEDMGKYSLNTDYIDKPMQTIANSYINWAMVAFGEANTPMFNWLKMLGYDLHQGNVDMINEARNIMANEPHYPSNGYIKETDEFIIVNI